MKDHRSSEWEDVRLGEVLRIEHGFAFRGEYFVSSGTDVLLTPKNFRREGGLDVSPARCKYYDGPIDEKFVLEAGDVVVAMTDLKQDAPILGAAGIVPPSGRFLHNQRIGKVVVLEPGRVDLAFVPWLINSPPVRQRIRATATGATVRHTAPSRIVDGVTRLPPPATQRRIASVLGAFDELIVINDRRLELLEDLARSLHREWFLRFRFPGRDRQEANHGIERELPDGWAMRRLGDLAQVVVTGVAAEDVRPDEPYVGLEHLPRRSTTLKQWSGIETVTSRKLRFCRADTLFGKIRPYFHKAAWAPFDGVASSDTIIVRAVGSLSLPALVNAVVSSDELVAEAVATSNGTKMPRANPDVLLRFPIALPPLDGNLIRQFEDSVACFLEMAAGLVAQNRVLATTRDLLLPRLVDGRLDISNVDLCDPLPPEDQ